MDALATDNRAERAWQRICRSAIKQKRASPDSLLFVVVLLKTICGATRFDKVADVLPKAKRNYVKHLKSLYKAYKSAKRGDLAEEKEWQRLDSACDKFLARRDPRLISLSGGRRSDKAGMRVIMMVSQDVSGLVYGLTGQWCDDEVRVLLEIAFARKIGEGTVRAARRSTTTAGRAAKK